MWDEIAGEWVALDSTVSPSTNTICASVNHFTPFAILAHSRPAFFVTSDLIIDPEAVEMGEDVVISVSVANTGDLTGSYEVSLKVDEVVVVAEDVTLPGGASQKVSFTITENAAGKHTVSLDRLTGEFTVRALSVSPTMPAPLLPAPVSSAAGPINWWLIGGIIAAGVIITGVVVWLVIIRRRASE